MNSRIRMIFSVALATLAPAGILLAQAVPQPAPAPTPVSIAPVLPPQMRDSDLQASLARLRAQSLLGRSSSTSVLVVPSAEMSMEDLGAATEDLTVMSRIFQTKLETAPSGGYTSGFGTMGDYVGYGSGYGNAVVFSRGPRTLQSLYLQGYGVLFTIDVDFPLAPGPQTTDEAAKDETQTDVDTVWQETRLEMLNPGASERRQASGEEGPKYSAEKVETLKTNVIESLKHAANIRALQPGQVVVVTITGKAAPFSSAVNMRDVAIVRSGSEVYRGDIPAGQFQTQAVMTIRAKIDDIKSYAGGEIDFEQFRGRTQILTYPKINSASGTGR